MRYVQYMLLCIILIWQQVQYMLQGAELVQCGIVRPRQDCADFCRHIFRELNGKADELANRHCNSWHLEAYSKPACCVRGFFDGSVKGDKAAFGWIVFASCVGDDEMSSWEPVACKSGCLPDGATITAAELEAALSLLLFLQNIINVKQNMLLFR